MAMPYYEQTHMTAPERDERILELRKRGLSYAKIGKQVGMSANGVMESLRRMAEGRPGRDPRY
jgi:IS30 family transposase